MLQHLVERFTTTALVGVDVGSHWLKLVELERGDQQPILRRCAVASLDGEHAPALLKRLLVQAGVTTTQAALGLASPEVIVRPFNVPPMPKKELESAVQLEAEQAILNGHGLSDMAIDWHLLSGPTSDTMRGVLAVVPKAVVSARLEIAEAAGLRPVVVDVEGLALWNTYWTLVGSRSAAAQTVLLVNVGARTTNLVIAKGPDALIMIRDVQLGADALAHGQGQEWVTELRDSLAYARSHGGLRVVESVVVTGGGSGPTLIPLLKSAVAAPITFWNPLDDLARDAQSSAVDPTIGPLLAVAIGLALRQPA